MLCLGGFELYSRWVPLDYYNVRQNTAVRNEQYSRKKQLRSFMPGGAHGREP